MTTRASVRFHVGDQDQILQAAFTGYDVAHPITGFGWSSSDASKATITPSADPQHATLHAVAAGTTNITITAHRFGAGDLTRVLSVAVWAAVSEQVEVAILSPTGSAS